jgi:hypothetical protein
MVSSAFIKMGDKMLNRSAMDMVILSQRATAQLGKPSVTQIKLKEQ